MQLFENEGIRDNYLQRVYNLLTFKTYLKNKKK